MLSHFPARARWSLVIVPMMCLVAACGGNDAVKTAAGAPASSADTGAPAAPAPAPAASSTETSAPPPAPAPAPAPVPGQAITQVVVDHLATGDAQNTLLTFGQVFAAGDLPQGRSLSAVRADGTGVPLQLDVKATHPDGSVRHAVLSGVLPPMGDGESRTLSLVPGTTAPGGTPMTAAALIAGGFSAGVDINLGGQVYRASADELLQSGQHTLWLSGPVVTEWLVSAPLKTASGVAHPHLTARFAIRAYAGQNRARVDVTLENNWAFEPGPQNFTYDATVKVGGQSVFSQAALNHFHHARWRKTFWWGGEPQLHLRHDRAYLMATKAIPNYDPTLTVPDTALAAIDSRWTASARQPMGAGIVLPAMPTTGGRPDIGPLPQWSALYVLSMDPRAKKVTLGTGDLAGSWPIHLRDKRTDLPVSLKDFPYMTLLGRAGDTVNPATKKSEAFPACGGVCSTAPYNYQPDSSHQPSLAFLPYVVTGDHFYLEELHFWANYNVVQANPYYRKFEKGLLISDQVRGQAWSLRTLGQAAYITPDQHPLKAYFTEMVGHNIAEYTSLYVNNPPNQLGVIDGTGQYAFRSIVYSTPAGPGTGLAPWQDDFKTWADRYLVDLGFDEARPLAAWKAKFPVGRMMAPGYCWIDGAVYALAVRPSATAPLYTSFAEAYQATMRGTDSSGAAIPLVNSTGAKYLDQPCGSQAQADWRTQQDKDTRTPRYPWVAGEMTGYATSSAGYPSNMQPALAAAVDAGIPQAREAWTRFMSRTPKPDYGGSPQFAIVPRE